MMLTMLPEGASVALSGICPGSIFGGGVRAWSSSTMYWCIAERVALALVAAKGLTLAVYMMGCSCRLGMILANLVSGSMWKLGREVVVSARCS